MSRPVHLELSSTELPWKSVPMPGSNLPLELRRLDSSGDSFVIHGRFPAGFERAESGGYAIPEEVIVVDGELTIESTTYRRGDLISVPANYERTFMATPHGCEVVAWFGGPAIFIPAAGLPPIESDDPVVTDVICRSLDDVAGGQFLSLPQATWVRSTTESPASVALGDSVTSKLEQWRRHGDAVVTDDAFVRIEK